MIDTVIPRVKIYGEDFNSDEDGTNLILPAITLLGLVVRAESILFMLTVLSPKQIKIRNSSKSLKEFIEIAESETQATEFNKQLFDYINYDRGNVIYKQSGCDTTRVLIRNGTRMSISEHVDVKCIDKTRHRGLLSRLKE